VAPANALPTLFFGITLQLYKREQRLHHQAGEAPQAIPGFRRQSYSYCFNELKKD